MSADNKAVLDGGECSDRWFIVDGYVNHLNTGQCLRVDDLNEGSEVLLGECGSTTFEYDTTATDGTPFVRVIHFATFRP